MGEVSALCFIVLCSKQLRVALSKGYEDISDSKEPANGVYLEHD